MELYRIVIDSYSPPSVFCCSYRCKFLLLALFATLLYSLDGRCEEERERAAEAGVKELAPTISLLPRSYISLVHFGCQMECVEWGVGSGKESFLLFPSLSLATPILPLSYLLFRCEPAIYTTTTLRCWLLSSSLLLFLFIPPTPLSTIHFHRWRREEDEDDMKRFYDPKPPYLSLSLFQKPYTPPLAIPKSKQVPFV